MDGGIRFLVASVALSLWSCQGQQIPSETKSLDNLAGGDQEHFCAADRPAPSKWLKNFPNAETSAQELGE